MEEKKIKTFAELILRLGVNVQKGQPVLINCPVEKAEIGRIFAEKAYEVGASYVKIKYGDEKLARIIISMRRKKSSATCRPPPLRKSWSFWNAAIATFPSWRKIPTF